MVTQTTASLLKALKRAGERMTAEEVRKQKISFIMGSLGENSTLTRERVEAELNKLAGLPRDP